MKKYKIAIVGATGLVGRTILKVLEEENLPIDDNVNEKDYYFSPFYIFTIWI